MMSSDTTDSMVIQLTQDGERWFSYQFDQGSTDTTGKMRARVRWFDDEKKLYVQTYRLPRSGGTLGDQLLKKSDPNLKLTKSKLREEEIGIIIPRGF